MQGEGFLNIQAVFVAQAGRGGTPKRKHSMDLSEVSHLLSGGLGGLGLLTARFLVERGATELVLSSVAIACRSARPIGNGLQAAAKPFSA